MQTILFVGTEGSGKTSLLRRIQSTSVYSSWLLTSQQLINKEIRRTMSVSYLLTSPRLGLLIFILYSALLTMLFTPRYCELDNCFIVTQPCQITSGHHHSHNMSFYDVASSLFCCHPDRLAWSPCKSSCQGRRYGGYNLVMCLLRKGVFVFFFFLFGFFFIFGEGDCFYI